MTYFRILIFSVIFIFTGCSYQDQYKPAPVGLSLSGIWIFDRQDEQSLLGLLRALNYVPPILNQSHHSVRSDNLNKKVKYQEQRMLRDLLVGLITIIPKELFIEQSKQQISIDFGVAGYHTFNIGKKTEIMMDGFELDAYAGWRGNDFFFRIPLGGRYQLIEKFTLRGDNQLVETIELQITGRDKPFIHQRYFERQLEK